MHVSTRQYSSKDLAGHTKMKQRLPGQNTASEVAKRDLKRELEDKERKAATERGRKDQKKDKETKEEPLLALRDKEDHAPERTKKDKNIDADDSDSSEEEGESSDEESDSEDETDELLRELERIKKEREQEKMRAEATEREETMRRREEAMLTSNPLLNDGDYSIKRKWYDDVVFKNQARDEPETKKRFINDTTRNDFARKFMKNGRLVC